MRRLLVTRRRVPNALDDDYRTAWADAAAAASRAGGRAWHFRAADDVELFLEFIEWKDDAGDVMRDVATQRATSALEKFGAAETGEWHEAFPEDPT